MKKGDLNTPKNWALLVNSQYTKGLAQGLDALQRAGLNTQENWQLLVKHGQHALLVAVSLNQIKTGLLLGCVTTVPEERELGWCRTLKDFCQTAISRGKSGALIQLLNSSENSLLSQEICLGKISVHDVQRFAYPLSSRLNQEGHSNGERSSSLSLMFDNHLDRQGERNMSENIRQWGLSR